MTLSSSTKVTGVAVSHVHSTHQQCKTADIVDVRTGQRAETEFHTVGGSSPKEIHRYLSSVDGGDAIHVSSDAGPVVLRPVRKTLVTGPAAAEQPWQ